MFQPGPDDLAGFLQALRILRELALRGDLTAQLRSVGVVHALLERWRAQPIPGRQVGPNDCVSPASVEDAIVASNLLEHYLRPLTYVVPRTDVTHAVSNGLASLIALGAKWDHGTPFLLTEHGIYLRERHLEYRQGQSSFAVRAFMVRFFRLLTSAAYSEADIVAPGSDYNGRWQRRQGAESDRIRRVHNGIDPTEFPTSDEPEIPTLSWLGRITPIKDLETLIAAFRLVSDQLPQARLRIFGSAPPGDEEYQRRCSALIEQLGLTSRVCFEGRVKASAAAYHAGTVVVLSSTSEGFPYTVIEAMAAGRATVSTDVGGVREAVGECGVIVPPRDPAALAAGCIQLLDDTQLRKRMAVSAQSRAHRLFTIQRCLDGYRSLYPVVVARAREAGPA